LEKLLADRELRERMGARGLERAEQFSVEAMVEELDGVYQELTGSRTE
jgi:glycosyltransferase involved in cell wall biosynthesis